MEKQVEDINNINNSGNGQSKCPRCGATDISLNINTGLLRCNFCRYEFSPQIAVDEDENDKLEGVKISAGAADIIPDTPDIVTLKCQSCGAEVVIDTASASHARCHWCRNSLSINEQIPNGAIPDVILPFKLKKDEAKNSIEKFVNKRKFFAHPKFTAEFNRDNICGVYFPYMVVDLYGHMSLRGQGEIETRRYTVGSKKNRRTYYDADAYLVSREFDLAVDDLTIEASLDKLKVDAKDKTSNIINSIMPFDTEKSVKYDSNYIKGFTSEKRDVNVNNLREIVHLQCRDIGKIAVNDTLKRYNRGVAWSKENIEVNGESWKAAYFPVWLYSYLEESANKKLLHYVAVNARTGETMGSIPINMFKLFITSLIVEFFGAILFYFTSGWATDDDADFSWIFLLSGFAFFALMYMRYRNSDARHTYEKETKKKLENMQMADEFLEHRQGLAKSKIEGANNMTLTGKKRNITNDDVLSKLSKMGLDLENLSEKAKSLEDWDDKDLDDIL